MLDNFEDMPLKDVNLVEVTAYLTLREWRYAHVNDRRINVFVVKE